MNVFICQPFHIQQFLININSFFLGQYLKGDTKMRYLPPIDASKDKTLMYDSSVDNVQIPTEFVIYNDTQAYPEYIITFSV